MKLKIDRTEISNRNASLSRITKPQCFDYFNQNLMYVTVYMSEFYFVMSRIKNGNQQVFQERKIYWCQGSKDDFKVILIFMISLCHKYLPVVCWDWIIKNKKTITYRNKIKAKVTASQEASDREAKSTHA